MRPTTPASSDRWKELLDQLEHKYQASGQDLNSYLEGLLYTEYLNYWDYVQLDTLLTLQVPRTAFPDEEIFIMYHQITELYFKLILKEIKQLAAGDQTTANWEKRISRINRYMEALIKSFDVMVDGMDPEEFMKFRMALLPASGFQSVQFRIIELLSTKLTQLSNDPDKDWTGASIEDLVDQIYWQAGATELSSGKQTLTLKRFAEKYGRQMRTTAADYQDSNLATLLGRLQDANQLTDNLRVMLRTFDASFNINWRLMHFKSAVRYLQREPEVIAATGGTNWQKYLPPRFQNRTFFPELWTTEERANWGRAWFEEVLAGVA
jgi:tryptophan 2,3-dioxygenase